MRTVATGTARHGLQYTAHLDFEISKGKSCDQTQLLPAPRPPTPVGADLQACVADSGLCHYNVHSKLQFKRCSSPAHITQVGSPILMRRCYLHIGTHKTGTSSIQRSLTQASLTEAGFYFPDTGKWTADSGHHGLASAVASIQYDALVDSLVEEISLVQHHVILSSEEFTHMLWRNPQRFQRLVDRLLTVVDDVTVILYLRRQADYIESNYLERLKSRFVLGFSSYAFARIHEDLAEFPLDYRRLIDMLDRVQNVTIDVRAYDGIRQSGALADFLLAIDWPADHPVEERRINESLPIVESLKNFCRAQLNRALSDAEERAIELIALSLPARPHMDLRTRRHLIQEFDASNRELADRFPLTPLVEAIPEAQGFGAWTGLGDGAPPHLASMWQVTLDHLFSRTFFGIVQAVSQRLWSTHSALAEQQTIAQGQHTQIATLQQALSETQAALTKTQALSLERYAQIEKLQRALAQTKLTPRWRRLFRQ